MNLRWFCYSAQTEGQTYQNSFGFIFSRLALSIGYVSITGVLCDPLRPDATPSMRKKCVLDIITVPLLGLAITLSAPHYIYGLIGAGLVLGIIPRMVLKAGALEKASEPRLTARQIEFTKKKSSSNPIPAKPAAPVRWSSGCAP